MSIEQMRLNIEGLQAALDALESAAQHNVRARARAVSVKAKNLMPGDSVEWGYGIGQREVAGWSNLGGEVLMHAQNAPLWSLGSEERVRVYRQCPRT